MQHKLFQVRNGVSFTGWLFGDSIPGPVLRVRVGRIIEFSMTDRTLGDTAKSIAMSMNMNMNMMPMPHSIDFHSAMVNPEDKYRSISPGETISFTWTANYPGVFMYHCGTPMVLMHMISGMFGMVKVELTTDVMYLQDGKVIFYKSIAEVQEETGEEKLSKAIAWYMKNGLEKRGLSYLKLAK